MSSSSQFIGDDGASDPVNRWFGYVPDPEGTERIVSSLDVPELERQSHVMAMAGERVNVYLWEAMMQVFPDWVRNAQGIGDCVSWGAELAVTMLLCVMAKKGLITLRRPAATEPIYGGCRVEVNGGRSPLGNGDGAAGSWAVDWLTKWGVLLREDYSQKTGDPSHDLTKYSAQRAKDWGSRGCGGGGAGKDALDEIAKLYPVQDASRVRTIDSCVAALTSGATITIASGVGFDGETRNEEGIVRARGQWPHQMMIGGLKWTQRGTPLFRIFNSHGRSVKGPDPGVTHKAVSDCSWWSVPEDVERILGDQDSFALSGIKWPQAKPYDFARRILV